MTQQVATQSVITDLGPSGRALVEGSPRGRGALKSGAPFALPVTSSGPEYYGVAKRLTPLKKGTW